MRRLISLCVRHGDKKCVPAVTKHPKCCHPERSRRTSATWVTYSAFESSALHPVAIPFARDDRALVESVRDWEMRRLIVDRLCETAADALREFGQRWVGIAVAIFI